ncbi:SRPBCC family protein [Lysobacter soli]|uniref:SRPBCC family protein n=1 Tax=Lysobacter soli TaxID=453783 RepID=UPI00240FF0CA|nr:SRPBCC family protein [Lysobacter soli]MDG2517157.1 SRPBCC family protein [Lysobacter soli]
MSHVPTAHTDFVIEREYAVSPQTVFAAWADPTAKKRWSDCHEEYTTHYSMDFRLHGHESHHVDYPDGRRQRIEKVFFDIAQGQRIVFAYDISVDGRKLSVSLVTIEFLPTSHGTRMRYVEQLAYLDGHEDREVRLRGTEEGLDRLGLELSAGAAAH